MAESSKGKRWLKRIAGIVGGLVVGLVCAYVAVTITARNKLAPGRFVIQPREMEIPTGERAVERGRHLVHDVLACTRCHGDDLGGKQFIDAMPMGRFAGVNLTRGQGGLTDMEDVDWVRAIRHGAGHDGRGLIFMPVKSYSQLGDDDLGPVIAYLKTLDPVDREVVPVELGAIGKFLVAFGYLPIDADDIDHAMVGIDPGPPAADARYGEYLVKSSGCTACHQEDLHGGEVGPDAPEAGDITAGGLSGWTAEDFTRAMREGRTPEGDELDELMPWRCYAGMTDLEVGAIWAYLQTTGGGTDAGPASDSD